MKTRKKRIEDMSYYVFNRVICSEEFLKSYFIDEHPFGKEDRIETEYLTFNKICDVESLHEYYEKYGAYIYYGFSHSCNRLDNDYYEIKFATSQNLPIPAILRAIEIDHSVEWYAVGEDRIYLSKFIWKDGRVTEMILDLENPDFYDWDDENNGLLFLLDDCDCEVWYYDRYDNDKWIEWKSDDLVNRYENQDIFKEYYDFKRSFIRKA